MKRKLLCLLLALAAIAVALFPSEQALAEDWGAIDLVNTGAEGSAFGHATLTNVSGPYWVSYGYVAYEMYSGDLSVDCGGLTPGKTYRICPTVTLLPSGKNNQKVEYYSFTASADGSGGTGVAPVPVQFYVVWEWYDNPVGGGSYYRISPDGFGFSVARKDGKTWTASLTGFFPNPTPD